MSTSVPVPDKAAGDVFTETMWDSYLRDNINKLLDKGHRVLTVAQFAALTGLEGTKGTVAPDEVYVEVDASSGVLWHFGFESGETTFKWRFLGGPSLYSEVQAMEQRVNPAYGDLATVGPNIVLPRSGDYDVEIGMECRPEAATVGEMSYDIGATAAVDADSIMAGNPFTSASNLYASVFRKRRKPGLGAVTLTAKYKRSAGGGNENFLERWMAVSPVRIRHDA